MYEDLFQESGSEIYLKPVTFYFEELPRRVRFAALIAAAQVRGGGLPGREAEGVGEGLEPQLRREAGPREKYGVRAIGGGYTGRLGGRRNLSDDSPPGSRT